MEKNFCKKCGTRLVKNALYCYECGTPVNSIYDLRNNNIYYSSYSSCSSSNYKLINSIFGNEQKNNVISPFSLYAALAILAEIANGNSRNQILELIGDTNKYSIYGRDNKNSENSSFSNSIWLSDKFNYKENCIYAVHEKFGAEIHSGKMGSEEYDNEIREWTDKATNYMLREYTKKIQTNPEEVMEIFSAIYFKEYWQENFELETHKGIFKGKNGEQEVEYMHKCEEGNYYYGRKFSAIGRRLEGEKVMYFVLPDKRYSPDKLFSDSEFNEFLDSACNNRKRYKKTKYCDIHEKIPKFSVSSKNDLEEILQNIGITDAFDYRKSDFSNLTDDHRVYVNAVEQNAKIIIDTKGVEAAAYTRISFCIATAQQPCALENVYFELDRPFIFFVKDYRGSILFLGTVYDIN